MFNKDLLLIDIESTGTNVAKHEIIQIAAILLDKKTLKEKGVFSTFIKPRKWKQQDPEAMAVNGITLAQVKNAPPLRQALQQLVKTFGTSVIVTVYAGNLDVVFFTAAFREQNMRYPYDYHTFDIWSLCYNYMARRHKLTDRKKFAGFSMESVAKHFRIPLPARRHQALIDCQIEAEVLRALMKAKLS